MQPIYKIAAIIALLILPLTASAVAFQPAVGGTGSTTLSGILIGNGTSPVNTLIVGSGLSLTGTTLTATGGSGVAYSFTPGTYGTLNVSATTTAALEAYLGLISATSTIGTVNATSSLTIAALSGLVGAHNGLTYAVSTSSLNASITGNAATVTNGVYTTDTGTVTNTMLAGSIANGKLSNSTISGVALGGTLNSLSNDAATLTGTSYNGSASVSNWAINLTNSNQWTASTTFTKVVNMQNSSTSLATISTQLYLSALTSTQCLHEVSGVVSGTGSDCGSGGGIGDPFTHPQAGTSATTSGMIFTAASSTFSSVLHIDQASTTNLEMTLYANEFPGSDIGAQINNAYAALPAAGGVIHVPAGSYSFSTAINFTTSGKYVLLSCDPGGATTMTYTGSATSTTFNISDSPIPAFGYGIDGCTFIGTNNTGVGVQIGGTNGAPGIVISRSRFYTFKTNIQLEANVWNAQISTTISQYGLQDLWVEGANNSGEDDRFIGDDFADSNNASTSNCVLLNTNALASGEFTDDSFDDCQVVVGDGNLSINFNGDHFENPNWNVVGQYSYIKTTTGGFSGVSVSGSILMNDATTMRQSPNQFILNGARLTLTGDSVDQNGSAATIPALINNYGANASTEIYGIKYIGTPYTNTATSSLFISSDAGNSLFSIGGTASTTNLTISAISGCNTTQALTTNSSGNVACGSVSGGGSAYPFTPSTFGIAVSATSTPILDYPGLIAATSTFGTILASSSITDQPLATPAGTFIAADPTGKLIATTSPSGSNSAFSPAANYATVAGLPSYTYSLGVITEVSNGALSVDGNNPTVGQIILVKNESGACMTGSGACNNGLYNVTAAGSAIAAFVLTRNSNYNSSSNVIPGIVTYVISGATLADDFWALTSAAPITVGTTALNYTEVSGGGASVTSVANSDSTLTISPTTGNVVASLNLAHTNTWSVLQNFAALTATNATTTSLSTGSTTLATLSGAGLSSCSGASNAVSYTLATGLFGCNSISGSALTGSIGQVAYFSASNTAVGTSSLSITTAGTVSIQGANTTYQANPFLTIGTSTSAIDGGGVDAVYIQDNNDSDAQLSFQNMTPGFGSYIKDHANSDYSSFEIVGTNGGDWKFGMFGTTNFNINDNGNSIISIAKGLNTNSLQIDGNGHLGFYTDATQPAVSTCGTNPKVNGDDISGSITVGTGAVSACTLTYHTAYTNVPRILFSVEAKASTTTVYVLTSQTAAAFTVTGSASGLGGSTINYWVVGSTTAASGAL